MKWTLEYLPEALNDLSSLDNSIRGPVIKGINKVLTNPLPKAKGGYGTPLGNKEGNNLTNLFKIKFLKYGIRVVYMLECQNGIMKVIIISARVDNQVYNEASRRRNTYDL